MRSLLLLLGLAWSGRAAAEEYRRVTLQDGRRLIAGIEDTTAEGLELVLPQGRTSVGFDQVANLEEVPASAFEQQSPWTVLVVPPDSASAALRPQLASRLEQALLQVPAVVLTRPERQARLTPAERQELAACGADLDCLQPYVDQARPTVALAARIDGPDVVIVSAWAGAVQARRVVSIAVADHAELDPGPLRQAVETALHLQPRPLGAVPLPSPAPPVSQPLPEPQQPPPSSEPLAIDPPPQAEPRSGPKPGTLRALAWLPLPGLPSAARGDWGGFAGSWAVVLPGTAAMVGVGGQASFTREQLLATGLGSYYLLTVAANKAFGLRGLDAGVAVQPLPGGGAMLGLQGSL